MFYRNDRTQSFTTLALLGLLSACGGGTQNDVGTQGGAGSQTELELSAANPFVTTTDLNEAQTITAPDIGVEAAVSQAVSQSGTDVTEPAQVAAAIPVAPASGVDVNVDTTNVTVTQSPAPESTPSIPASNVEAEVDVTAENVTVEQAQVEQAATVAASTQPPPPAPIISDARVSLVTEESAQIEWDLDQPATGVIEYGRTRSFDLASAPENSFRYSGHRQVLKNLLPGTEYFLQAISVNEAGEETRSEVISFTTPASNTQAPEQPPEPTPAPAPETSNPTPTVSTGSISEGWPDVFDDTLPLAGIFYGNYKAGLLSGNAPLAAENAIRFRAERTGMVNAVRYNNRRILPTDINHRCDLYGKGSVWCNCKDGGLDSWSCGYTLPNAYHVGSGGQITIELRDDDGTANHLPGPNVLGQTATYQPATLAAKFPTLSLNTSVQVEAGKIYHIVFRNDKPPSCDLRRLTIAQAAACPRDEGAIGMNGTKHGSDESAGSRFGPVIGDISGRVLYKPKKDSPWRISTDVITFYELRYDDNEYVGNSYTGFDNWNYDESKGGSQIIEGNIKARQMFTVENATREVDGLWFNYGHAFDRPSNGQALSVSVKDAGGTVLATGTLPASKACSDRGLAAIADGKARGNREEWTCRVWNYTQLSQPLSLLEGSSYSVEFTAPAGAAYALSTYFSVHRQPERNIWHNAHAEISRNGGSKWDLWIGQFFPSRDLPVVFTIVGMPKQLP